MLIEVDNFVFPNDFVILDIEDDHFIPFILGKPLLNTARASINVYQEKLILRIDDDHVKFDLFNSRKEQILKK